MKTWNKFVFQKGVFIVWREETIEDQRGDVNGQGVDQWNNSLKVVFIMNSLTAVSFKCSVKNTVSKILIL
jgi:hypothetical protein